MLGVDGGYVLPARIIIALIISTRLSTRMKLSPSRGTKARARARAPFPMLCQGNSRVTSFGRASSLITEINLMVSSQ